MTSMYTPHKQPATQAFDIIRAQNDHMYAASGNRPTVCIQTFGCQMNARDSETIAGLFADMGYAQTNAQTDADFILYNTCCIRDHAEQRIFGKLGYLKTLKRKNPALKIAVCGCMIQQETVIDRIAQKYNHVDILFGTFNLHLLPEYILANQQTGSPVYDIWESHDAIVEDLPSIRKYPYKASVNIMFGCNNFCAYCIVPYVRGRERSREPQKILAEVKTLATDGVKEIMLLGQNVNSYGKTLTVPMTFAALLHEIAQIPGIDRIRFMTSHPKDLSDELIDVIAKNKNICNHIHLPVQSGSTNVLKRMNRGYTKEDYLALITRIKSRIPNIAITTDIIVGFPDETDADFLDTLDVVEKAQFTSAFTFIFSKRAGTPAAGYDALPEEVIRKRFDKLTETVNQICAALNQQLVGQTLTVLPEEVSQKQKAYLTGRTQSNAIVHFKGDEPLIGRLVPVKITGSRTFYLEGELV